MLTGKKTMSGLGKSSNSRFYSIKSAQEATEYLAHPVLGRRLRGIAKHLYHRVDVEDLLTLLGNGILVAKAKSCFTLFATLSYGTEMVLFMKVLIKFWDGESCEDTLRILSSWTQSNMESD